MEEEKKDLTEVSSEIDEQIDKIINDKDVDFNSREEKKAIIKMVKNLNKGNLENELLTKFENKIMSQREQKLLVKQYFKSRFMKDFWKITLSALLISITFDYFISITGRTGLFPAGIGAMARFFATVTYPNPDQIAEQSSFYFVYYLLINAPLFIFGYIKLGKHFTFTTFLYIVMQIAFDQLLQNIPYINPKEFHLIVNSQLIGSLSKSWNTGIWLFIFGTIGGILLGSSYSIIYRIGCSTGGLDFVTVWFSNKHKKPLGTLNRRVNLIILACTIVLNTIIIPANLINADIKIDVLQNYKSWKTDQKLLNSIWDYAVNFASQNKKNLDPIFLNWFPSIDPNILNPSLPCEINKEQYNFLVEYVCGAGYGKNLGEINKSLLIKVKILFVFGPSLFASFILVMCAGISVNHFYPKYTIRTFMIITNSPKEINRILLERGFQNDILTWDSINRINGNYLHRSVIMVAMSVMDWTKVEKYVFLADPLAKINAISTPSVKGLFNYEIKKNDERDIVRTKMQSDELEKEKIRQIALVWAQKQNEKIEKKLKAKENDKHNKEKVKEV